MKVYATLLLLTFSAGLALGGEPVLKNPVVMMPEDPVCFAPGIELSIFAAGALPESGDDELGGGIGLAYYFTQNVGIDVGYSVFAYDSEKHTATADLALRYPIGESCFAPYLLMGGGVKTNGSTDGLWRLGGGVDVRFQGANLGVFADGVYNWVEGDGDFTIARLGVRIPF